MPTASPVCASDLTTSLHWFGVALQVVGLLGAMALLLRLRERVTGGEVVPLSWRSGDTVVFAGTASATASVGAVRITTTGGAMPDGPVADQVV
jgi:hypothetical protein